MIIIYILIKSQIKKYDILYNQIIRIKKNDVLSALLGKWYTSSLVMNNHQFDSDKGLKSPKK